MKLGYCGTAPGSHGAGQGQLERAPPVRRFPACTVRCRGGRRWGAHGARADSLSPFTPQRARSAAGAAAGGAPAVRGADSLSPFTPQRARSAAGAAAGGAPAVRGADSLSPFTPQRARSAAGAAAGGAPAVRGAGVPLPFTPQRARSAAGAAAGGAPAVRGAGVPLPFTLGWPLIRSLSAGSLDRRTRRGYYDEQSNWNAAMICQRRWRAAAAQERAGSGPDAWIQPGQGGADGDSRLPSDTP
jgi:hypothetical protein